MTIRVLLVDDVVALRRLLRMALRLRGGFEVVAEAGGGAEAVRMAELHQPDVVVLDLGLPDIAGREVLSRVRIGSPGSKVVVFSGTNPEDRGWLERQADGYVVKDTEIDYLVTLLETVGRSGESAATLELPRELSSVRLARRFVAEKLAEWDLEVIADDALLVASELAANAITHAESTCRIRLSLTPQSFRIDVFDTGTGTPEPQPASATLEHGRGLHLVAAITTAWGLEVVPGTGKLVWAELARPQVAAGLPA
jgi:DNA-binding NarL/FixJ family response regulator